MIEAASHAHIDIDILACMLKWRGKSKNHRIQLGTKGRHMKKTLALHEKRAYNSELE